MTTILDLPIHPLAVHAPVVVVPLLVLFGLLYLFIPPLRRAIGWIPAVLTLIAPAVVYGAIWSGEQLADHLYPDGWPEAVQDHRNFGYQLLWVLIGLIPVWWLFAALERGRRSALARNGGTATTDDEGETASTGDADPAATGRRIFMFILGVVALALLGLAGYIVFNSGDTGARMVWEGKISS